MDYLIHQAISKSLQISLPIENGCKSKNTWQVEKWTLVCPGKLLAAMYVFVANELKHLKSPVWYLT